MNTSETLKIAYIYIYIYIYIYCNLTWDAPSNLFLKG